jgi:Domain of unknown function (DUF4440)
MKRAVCTFALAVVSAFLAGCGAPATTPASNTTANLNSNASSKPVAAAPTKEALLDMDRKANEAYMKGDSQFFQDMMSDKFIMYEGGNRITKNDSVKMIGGLKCDFKDLKLDEPQMSMVDADTYVVSYKTTANGRCNTGPAGSMAKIPSPVRSASVYIRQGDKWAAAFHGENLIFDPKNMPSAPAAGEKNREAPAKDAKPPANANTSSPASPIGVSSQPAPDPNTDALVKIHTSGWEAFKAKDAKKFDDITTPSFSFVDAIGTWYSGRSAVVNHWTSEMKCEGINNVKVSDGVATGLSPTVEVLTLKGTADGTCDGVKNGDLYQTAIYVKEGDMWKLAFMFESMPQ